MRTRTWACLLMWLMLPAAMMAGDIVPPSTAILSAELRAELLAVAEQVVALGMPDARGGTLFKGALAVTRPPGGPEGKPDTQIFNGVHVRRADGSWLANRSHLVPVRDGYIIDASKLQRATVADLDHLADSNVSDENAILSAISLMRLDIPGAEQIALRIAHRIVLEYCRPLFRFPTFLYLDHRLGDADRDPIHAMRLASQDPAADTTPPATPNPAANFRLHCAQWFIARAIYLNHPIPPRDRERALTIVRALTDPRDTAVLTELDRLAIWLRLPTQVPRDADLPTRLMSWDGYFSRKTASITTTPTLPTDDSPDRNHDDKTQRGLDTIGEFSATEFGELVALAGDTRLSRWLQDGRVRTVGDQALRAMAAILGFDPRHLIRRNPSAPWDDAERAATAHALQAWWSLHRARPLPETILEVLPDLPLIDILDQLLLGDLDMDLQFDRLAHAWKSPPAELLTSPNQPPHLLPVLLELGSHHAAFMATVDTWAVTGESLPWAIWHLARGRRQDFDAALNAALNASTDDNQDLNQLLPVLYRIARPADLQRFQNLLIGAPDREPLLRLLRALGSGSPDNLVELFKELQKQPTQRRGHDRATLNPNTMLMALLAQLMGDTRPLPVVLNEHLAELAAAQRHVPKRAEAKRDPVLKDARIADLGAFALFRLLNDDMHKNRGFTAAFKNPDLRFDPTAPIAERDRAIKAMARCLQPVLTSLLTDAKLPLVIPGFDALLTDSSDRSLF